MGTQIDLAPGLTDEARGILQKVASGKLDIEQALGQLRAPTPPPARTPVKVEPLPEQVLQDLRDLPDDLVAVTTKVVRELTGPERAKLLLTREKVSRVKKVLEDFFKNGVRERVLQHNDLVAERVRPVDPETGRPFDPQTAERDANGHYLLSMRTPAPETGKVFSWEVPPAKPYVDSGRLAAALAAGQISQEEYEGMTSVPPTPEREWDPPKATAYLSRRPELARRVAGLALAYKDRHGSLNVRDSKGDD